MAFKGVTLDDVVRYVSPRDPDPENPTVWLLRPLSARVHAKIRDDHLRFAGRQGDGENITAIIQVNQQNYETVRHGLSGWENFPGAVYTTERVLLGGKNENVVTDKAMSFIPRPLINEFAAEILRITDLGPEEAKRPSDGDADAAAEAGDEVLDVLANAEDDEGVRTTN